MASICPLKLALFSALYFCQYVPMHSLNTFLLMIMSFVMKARSKFSDVNWRPAEFFSDCSPFWSPKGAKIHKRRVVKIQCRVKLHNARIFLHLITGLWSRLWLLLQFSSSPLLFFILFWVGGSCCTILKEVLLSLGDFFVSKWRASFFACCSALLSL